MYAAGLKTRDRGGALAAVGAVHAALALVFLNLSGKLPLMEEQPDLRVFDVEQVQPTPPTRLALEEQSPETEQAPEPEGAASPENIRSQATPIVAPEPPISLPIPLPVNTTETPNEGAAPTQGASDVRGPGTGAGGSGTGTGAGGSGSGTGGGGTGQPTRPVLITPTLEGRRDYPREVLRRWPRGGRVFVRFQVDPEGRPFNCNIDRSSGDQAVDRWTCSLVLSKLRFRPATDERGRPVASWYGYVQAPTNF